VPPQAEALPCGQIGEAAAKQSAIRCSGGKDKKLGN